MFRLYIMIFLCCVCVCSPTNSRSGVIEKWSPVVCKMHFHINLHGFVFVYDYFILCLSAVALRPGPAQTKSRVGYTHLAFVFCVVVVVVLTPWGVFVWRVFSPTYSRTGFIETCSAANCNILF